MFILFPSLKLLKKVFEHDADENRYAVELNYILLSSLDSSQCSKHD